MARAKRCTHFPDTGSVLAEPAGLLAAGGSLDVECLLVAYRQGIFPWFTENEPILWWSSAPRTVLYPTGFHQRKSLQKLARQQRYQLTEDRNFETVINAYTHMHRASFAHSIECRRDRHRSRRIQKRTQPSGLIVFNEGSH